MSPAPPTGTDEPLDADVPAWERALRALDKALDEPPEARTGIVLTWRVRVVEEALERGVEVSPWIQKLGKRGVLGAAKRLGRRHLLIEHGSKLSPEDARIAELLPDHDAYAGRALLESLVEHPRVALEAAPDRLVRVDRATVGLVAEHRGNHVRVGPGIDGTALPPGLRERVARVRAEEALFLWDGGRLTLLDVRPELKAALHALGGGGNREALFPPESQASLLQALAKWSSRVPVTLPRSVAGEAVPPETSPVLRLEAQPDGTVEIEVRVRPLEGAASVAPGLGSRDVHVRVGQRTLHAVRALAPEEAVARAFVDRLPLAGAEPVEDDPYRYSLLSADAALELLRECATFTPPPELEWIGLPLRSLGPRGPGSLRVLLSRRHEWFGVLGGLSVEGERVAIARLLDAVKRKEKHVHVVAGTYVEMSEALRQHLASLADHLRPHRDGLELGPSANAHLHALERAGADIEGDEALRASMARLVELRDLDVPVPATLRTELRDYQREGFVWLARLSAWGAGGVLADDMGLGKTVQTLALLLHRASQGPALVVAPTSVAFNWREEAARFAPSLRLSLYGEATDRAESLRALGPGDVLVVSYGLLVRDAADLKATRFATAIFDEAQNVKNAGTQRFRAAAGLSAELRIALSGTPMENHLGELWSLFAVVFPALLGPWPSFRTRFAAPIEKGLDPAAAPALVRVLTPFLLRRTKAAVESQLPPRTEIRVPIALSTEEHQLYEDARLAALSDLGKKKTKQKQGERRIQVLAALTRLRLMACHPRLVDARSDVPSSKLSRLLELVDELGAEGQRALIFSQFTSHLALVRAALDERRIEYLYLDGQTPAADRGELVKTFREGTAPLFLISLKAGGAGINLVAATNVIHLDPWWNPAVEDQASDRAHRLGQTKPVTVYRLVSLGTIEEQMIGLHVRKRALVDQILGDGETFASLDGALPLDELEAMLEARSDRWE